MGLRILFIDPSSEWLSEAKSYFSDKGYEVETATNGKNGQLAIYNSVDAEKNFFYVVLNLEVTNHSGLQVMKFIKSKHPTLNVCLTLDSDELLKTGAVKKSHVQRLGAQDLLIKPFSMDDLLGEIEGHQSLGQLVSTMPKREGQSSEEEIEQADENFTSIDISEFYPNKNVIFDVYIKLNVNKYVKILHAGDAFSKDRIMKYKEEKNIKKLYFHVRDRKKYIKFCNFLAAQIIKKNGEGSSNIKVGILRSTATKFLEEISMEGLKPQTLDEGKEICANIYNMVESDEDLFKVLKDFAAFDPDAFSHSYLVCLFASMIVNEFEWQSKATIETVAMAALFHDIGKMKLPPELLTIKPDDMTESQYEQYKKHPEIGAQIVDGNKMINNSVKQVIIQHHEFSDGSGFPQGVKDAKILTLSKILSLANYFADYVIHNEVKPVIALKEVLSDPKHVKKFNGAVLEKFMMVFVDSKKKKKSTELQSNSRVVNKKVS